MRLVEAALPMFARHETFHPRYGWFRKAYACAARDPSVFAREDAPVVVGVGKNMVRSIRFWGLAAKLLIEDPKSPNPRSPLFVPTQVGHGLFGEGGWDPYMEDPGTLWLLHWLLMAPPCRLPIWWLAFNRFDAVEFEAGDLEIAVDTQLEAVPSWKVPHPRSRQKDVRVLLRSYGPPIRSARTSVDDILDCPLRELRLIEVSPATGWYRFNLGPKPTLPSEMVVYASLDYVARTETSGNTVTVSRLAYEPGGPGRVFKLTEAELLQALEPAVGDSDVLDIVTLTGASLLSWRTDPAVAAVEVLESYYQSLCLDVRAGHYGDLPVDDDLLEDLGLGRNPSETMRKLYDSIPVKMGGH